MSGSLAPTYSRFLQMQTDSFTLKIKSALEERIKKNPQYSLRAYAKQLGVSAATLSGILSGKRKLTPEMMGKIGFALNLAPEEVWNFQKETLGHEQTLAHDRFKELSQEMFMIVSEWYHLTILELMKLSDFKPDVRWISKRLGVNSNQIQIAIERLQRVGILEIKGNVWMDKTDGFTTHYNTERTSDAKKRYQKQLLEKSLESIDRDDYSIRDHSSIAMAIDTKDILKAKKEIQAFRKRLSETLESTPKPNEVYQLQIGFFPLTTKEQTKKENKKSKKKNN
jgi:uncharacterized protein (TIGR02147 family)